MTKEQKASMYMLEEKKDKTLSDYKLLEEWKDKRIAELEEKVANLEYLLEGRDNEIDELEEKISILLSCKNCPENKGGLICQKEYENKCLAQKIQYIKELLEENTELKEKLNFCTQYYKGEKAQEQLTNAKEIIRDLLGCLYSVEYDCISDLEEAEQFISEVEK